MLIKHLPKQMSKLRQDKSELEDRVAELESRLARQAADMGEMERRRDAYKHKLEQQQSQQQDTKQESTITVSVKPKEVIPTAEFSP